tara:strand:- start:920 stop:1429 length:510 start_codon:yes stop_codon:yes gene_type:complete
MDFVFKAGVCILLFVIVGYMLSKNKVPKPYEGFVSGQCPTTLIKKGNQILLYNPDMAKVPGVNPIMFKTLKEYEKYIQWQRASGLKCPILHLEKVFDAQGAAQYEIRKSFMLNEPTGAMNHDLPNPHKKKSCGSHTLNANIENKPYNQNMYPSFDPYNQDIGKVMEIAL